MSLGGGSAAHSGTASAASGDDAVKYRYHMDHRERGQFIIINNKNFHPQTQMNVRSGTDVDASSLYTDFVQMGFNVELHHNQTADQMLQLMIRGWFHQLFLSPTWNFSYDLDFSSF